MIRQNYYPSIDFLKVLGLYLMVLGHGAMVDNTWHQLIYSFHMPMFFMISGFLFKVRLPIDTAKRAFSSLFVPYLLFNGLLLIYNIIYLVYKGSLSFESIVSRIIPILLGLGYNTNDLHPVCTPMWFFYSLFMLQVIVSLFARWKHGLLCLFSLCIAFVCIKRYVDFDTLIPIDSTLIAIPFFLLGYWAKDFLVKFSDQKYAIFIAFLCLLLGLCISKYNGRVDMNTCKLGNSILGFYAIAGVISSSLLLLFLRIKKSTLNIASGGVKILSMGAPVVVGLNLLLIPFIKLAFIISMNLQWNNLLGIIAGFLLMFIFIPIILFCQRFLPAFLGNRKIL